jgi:hypothetical protein
VVWAQFRALGSQQPKWLAPPADLASPTLFARDLKASLRWWHLFGRAVVCEGPADVVALRHAFRGPAVGFPGGGVQLPELAQVLASHLRQPAHVDIATDADEQGDHFAEQLGAALEAQGVAWSRLRPPEGLDLDAWRAQAGDDQTWQQQLTAAMGDLSWP